MTNLHINRIWGEIRWRTPQKLIQSLSNMLYDYVIFRFLFLQVLSSKSYTTLHTHVALCVPGFEVRKRWVRSPISAGNSCYWKTTITAFGRVELTNLVILDGSSGFIFTDVWKHSVQLASTARVSQAFLTAEYLFPLSSFSRHRNATLIILAKLHSPLGKKQADSFSCTTPQNQQVWNYCQPRKQSCALISTTFHSRFLLFKDSFLFLSLKLNRVFPVAVYSAAILPAPRLSISKHLWNWVR